MNKPIPLKSVCCFPLLFVQQDAWPSVVCMRGVGDAKWPLCLLLIALNALTRLKFSNYLFLKICVKKKFLSSLVKIALNVAPGRPPVPSMKANRVVSAVDIVVIFLTGAWQRDRIPESCQAGYRYSVFWQELHCAGVWGEHQVWVLVLLQTVHDKLSLCTKNCWSVPLTFIFNNN